VSGDHKQVIARQVNKHSRYHYLIS